MQCCASRQPRLPHLFEQPAPEPALVPNTTGTASAEHLNVRNRELSALKLKELRRRAADSGATEDEIEGAEEGESVKAALIGLVVAKELEVAAPRQEARKRELSALKLKELRRRAVEAGATEDEIEGAEESESVKAALVELVVAKEPPPDRGAVAEAAKAAAAAAANRMLAALEQELGQLKLKEIRRRAADSGAAEDEIEDAEESEDVRAALVALVVSHTRKGTPVADLSGAEPAEQSPGAVCAPAASNGIWGECSGYRGSRGQRRHESRAHRVAGCDASRGGAGRDGEAGRRCRRRSPR
jgi:hypothetical protein